MAKPHLCFEKTDGTWPIRLWQTGIDQFRVEYGEQSRQGLNYPDAASELGAAIMHLAACEGQLDNRSEEEAAEAGDTEPFFA